MPLFLCSQCGCIENTALSNYWTRNLSLPKDATATVPPLCSACDPTIGTWHGEFEKRVPDPATVTPNMLGGDFIDISEPPAPVEEPTS